MERNERPGRMVSGFAYKSDEWREHGIRAKRFEPCPHCGSVVSGREEFIDEVNRRCKTDSAVGFDGAAKEEETTCRSCSKQATSGRRDTPARLRR